ncbi:hypothetical protein AZE42_08431, partial [Rhizopogon vesiculosus]
GSTSHLLARLITRDDGARKINALLVATSKRLKTESNCANSSGRRALECFNRLRQATDYRPLMKQRLLTWLAQAAKASGTGPLQDHGIRISSTLEYLLRNVPFEVVKTKGR